MKRLGLRPREYLLATLHRAENVDDLSRLKPLLEGLDALAKKFGQPAIVSLHPHTADRMKAAGLSQDRKGVRFVEPLGFFDFVSLERNARLVVTDSGTVQEECCILHVPNITIRDTTERPETLEVGSNILTGMDPGAILRCAETALEAPPEWTVPPEYLERHVSSTVARIVMGQLPFRRGTPAD